MRLTIIGIGYVGLVSGACLADFGHTVTCVDIDRNRVKALQNGIMPIFEPGLKELVEKNSRDNRLIFTDDLASGVKNAEAVFLAVGTPPRPGDGHADLSFVYAAVELVALAATGPLVVITKSTVPVGTGDEVQRILSQLRPDIHFHVVSNPEFLREGAAISDFKRPDRIIVGTESEEARIILKAIYRPLYLNKQPILFVSRRTSELIKYAANAFLATKITFINEIADLCEKTGADVQDVSRGIGLDGRIGAKFLHAGPGYGGSCFPKDTTALVKSGQDHDAPLRIVEAVVAVNENRKRAMGRKIIAACGGNVRGKIIAVLGLAFKPNTDDMRDAPSIAIVTALQDAGAQVRAYDPECMEASKRMMPTVEYVDGPYQCIAGADAVAIVTEWDEFRALDLSRVVSSLRTPIMIDLRNIYSLAEIEAHKLDYHSIGRSK